MLKSQIDKGEEVRYNDNKNTAFIDSELLLGEKKKSKLILFLQCKFPMKKFFEKGGKYIWR